MRVFLSSSIILKNWYILPKIYFGKIQGEFVDLISRSGIIIKIRNMPSTDIHIFTEIWINNEYSEKLIPSYEESLSVQTNVPVIEEMIRLQDRAMFDTAKDCQQVTSF